MTGPGGLGTGVERFDSESASAAILKAIWCRCDDCARDAPAAVEWLLGRDAIHIAYQNEIEAQNAALEAECARLRGKIEEVRAVNRYDIDDGGTESEYEFGHYMVSDDVFAILDREA